jgi:hypothetical protein
VKGSFFFKKKLREQKRELNLSMKVQFYPLCLQEKWLNSCLVFKFSFYSFNCFNSIQFHLIFSNEAPTKSQYCFLTLRGANAKPDKTNNKAQIFQINLIQKN